MRGGHFVNDRGRGQVHHHVAGQAAQRGVHGQRQHVVVIEHAAGFVGDSQAVAIGILREADLGAGGAHQFGQIAERIGARFGDARKRLGGIGGNGVQVAAQRVAQEADGHDGTCAVHRI